MAAQLPIPLQYTGTAANDALAVVFYFMVYSFGGWLLENLYSKVTTGRFWKDGFLQGPFKPMYGIAPLLLLPYAEQGTHLGLLLLLCLLIPTFVEYVSGWLLEKVFYRKWWDYSSYRLQLHGHVCLSFSICWMFLSLAVVYGLHPLLKISYTHVAAIWNMVCPMFVIYFWVDMAWTVWSRRREGKAMASSRS
ncbi:putative ABC transporter permease [Paenibacillus alvei]|uniref:putative ABC transporter permease n=1 Tax=Paenibacillus alvei TaxID=44250 RepID=UPI00227F9888|nr:putative ABC transporter permease [Paenibacillus alvei]MCY7484209.1 putative ABC transporter permease [Paenibacillus alvei]